MDSILLTNAQLISQGEISSCAVWIDSGHIKKIVKIEDQSAVVTKVNRVIDLKNQYISHGFVDVHLHGGGGYDFMDNSLQAYGAILTTHLEHGTTALVPTTVASTLGNLTTTHKIYEQAKETYKNTVKMLGLHFEGPYLAPSQAGAQETKYMITPKRSDYEDLVKQCPHMIRWTIAPELPGAMELGEYLVSQGVQPSIGHSAATYEEVRRAICHGYRQVTHLYSATSSIVREHGYRIPGIVESTYLLEALTCEIIADGAHLPPSLLEMVYRFIGPERTVLVTDAMRGAAMPEGPSVLGNLDTGLPVIIEEGVAKLTDRSGFAGSVATADRLLRTMVQAAKLPLAQVVRMMTETPAIMLGQQQHVGFVKENRRADLVVLDEHLQISKVFLEGEIVVDNEKTYKTIEV